MDQVFAFVLAHLAQIAAALTAWLVVAWAMMRLATYFGRRRWNRAAHAVAMVARLMVGSEVFVEHAISMILGRPFTVPLPIGIADPRPPQPTPPTVEGSSR